MFNLKTKGMETLIINQIITQMRVSEEKAKKDTSYWGQVKFNAIHSNRIRYEEHLIREKQKNYNQISQNDNHKTTNNRPVH